MAIRYQINRLTGDGVNPFVAGDVPLLEVSLSNAMSGPDSLSASFAPGQAQDWVSLVTEGDTAIVALDGATVVNATLVDSVRRLPDGGASIVGVGFTAYPDAQPYRSERAFIQADPSALVKHCWQHVQSYPDCNLGVAVDAPATPVRLGKAPRFSLKPYSDMVNLRKAQLATAKTKEAAAKRSATASGATQAQIDAYAAARRITAAAATAVTAAAAVLKQKTAEQARIPEDNKPYVLAWYETQDLGRKWNELADTGDLDYRMSFTLSRDGALLPRLVMGRPLGRQRTDVRLVAGENIFDLDGLETKRTNRFSDYLVVGAGEGAAALRQFSAHRSGTLGRCAVVVDQAINSKTTLSTRLSQLTQAYDPEPGLTSFSSYESSLQLGDTVWVSMPRTGTLAGLDQWVRVLTITINPATGLGTYAVQRQN